MKNTFAESDEYKALHPLHYAAATGDVESIRKQMLGKDVDSLDCDGMTPLQKAAEAGHADVVELLVDSGAYIEQRIVMGDEVFGYFWLDGTTPLWLAVKNGHTDAVGCLLSKGAKTEQRSDPEELTVLMQAMIDGNHEIMRLLVANGASVNTFMPSGQTVLHWAVIHGDKESAAILRSHGAKEATA